MNRWLRPKFQGRHIFSVLRQTAKMRILNDLKETIQTEKYENSLQLHDSVTQN